MPSTWARFALAVLLLLSLGLKAWTSYGADRTDDAADSPALLEPLGAKGFALSQEDGLEAPFAIATRGDCRIEVTTVSALGWHQAAMAARAEAQALSYVYAGRVYAQQPVMLTKVGYYWQRLVGYFGPSRQPQVFAVITSPACAGQAIDATVVASSLR